MRVSVLDPAGPAGREIADVWWLMAALGTLVFAIVVVLLLVGNARHRPQLNARRLIVAGGIALPLLVLIPLTYATLGTSVSLARPQQPELVVEIRGSQFWWEARYPDLGVVTANEIHIPVDTRVQLVMTSEDVIHSFWAPNLNGKTDLIPGRITNLELEADTPGVYRGQCAEFCGLSHAYMSLFVVARPTEDFEAWAEARSEPAVEPETEQEQRGREIFMTSQCVACHTIRGTPADGEIGPDLTHVASRDTIAAGLLETTTESLRSWIRDPRDLKPGARMPAFEGSPGDLEALVAYLESLE